MGKLPLYKYFKNYAFRLFERIGVMVRDNRKKNQKRKEFVVVALACCLCLSAIAIGTTMINKKSDKTEKDRDNIVDLNETTDRLERETEDSEINDNLAVDGEVNKKNNNYETSSENDTIQEETKSLINYETNSYSNSQTDTQNDIKDVSAVVSELAFNKDSKLKWPVEGNIILDYSMDSTIYFPTLDSYKCNPAIVIQSEAGTKVLAGVKGVVKEVSANDEIGNYIVLSLGNDYELTLGQLENIELNAGDLVSEDTSIGVVANPTRYYSNEGSNLYYKLTINGEPCNPLDYLS